MMVVFLANVTRHTGIRKKEGQIAGITPFARHYDAVVCVMGMNRQNT
jgi:hypothetical protein